jgi:1-acyl-sn-glycerol-3-phosphate acyltransferase
MSPPPPEAPPHEAPRRISAPRTLAGLLYIVAATLVIGTLILLTAPLALLPRRHRDGQKSGGRPALSLIRAWCRGLLAVAGVRVRCRGLEHLDGLAGAVLVANHQSYLDGPAIIAAAPLPLVFVGKQSLFRIPFFGWSLSLAGYIPIPIDPRRSDEAKRLLDAAAAARLAAGENVLIFPEGSRARRGSDGRVTLLPFKKGGAIMALRAGVPIVPVSLSGAAARLPVGSCAIAPGTIELTCHPPIATAGRGLEARDELTAAAHAAIVGGLGGEEGGEEGGGATLATTGVQT